MNKTALLIGSILGMLTVAIGAFGAHGLKDILLSNGRLDVFETAVRYQFYHATALLTLGIIGDRVGEVWIKRAMLSFASGVVIFSGSLYCLSITNVGVFGAITPIGGLLLMLGWLFLILGIVSMNKNG